MRQTRTFLLIIFTLYLSACSLSSKSNTSSPTETQQPVADQESQPGPLYPLIQPDPVAGADIFAENCAACHGINGLGDGPNAANHPVPIGAINTVTVSRPATPAEWYTLITDGDMERSMPPFGHLTSRQRWDMVAYVFSLSAPAESIASGQELYQANCAGCHGSYGQGDGAEAANLTTAPRDFTDQAFMAEYSATSMYAAITQGIDPAMPAFADEFTEAQVWAITDYLRSLTLTTHDLPTTEAQADTPTATPEIDTPTSELTETGEPATTPSAVVEEIVSPLPGETGEPTTTTDVDGFGTITVTVTNGTIGGEVPADILVTLFAYDNMQMAFTQSLQEGENGVYTFENIEMLAERAFLAGVDYQGGTYGSDVIITDLTNPAMKLSITIYETSTDTSVLFADRLHIFLDTTDPDLLHVEEIYIISNPTDRTIIATEENGPVVFFPLPEEYQDLTVSSGMMEIQYQEVPGGFIDTASVPPGASSYQVVVDFNLPYDQSLKFNQTMSMNTTAAVIMLPENGGNLEGDTLEYGGLIDIQGMPFHKYVSSNLSAGSDLSFDISTGGTKPPILAIVLGALGVGLVGVGVVLYLRNRNAVLPSPVTVEATPEVEMQDVSEEAESLMDAIIALDDQFQAGEIPEDAYRLRRAELKDRLQRLQLN